MGTVAITPSTQAVVKDLIFIKSPPLVVLLCGPLQLRHARHQAAARRSHRSGSTSLTPDGSVAEIVVRTIERNWLGPQGLPRCIVARLSHMTTSPGFQLCTYVCSGSVARAIRCASISAPS